MRLLGMPPMLHPEPKPAPNPPKPPKPTPNNKHNPTPPGPQALCRLDQFQVLRRSRAGERTGAAARTRLGPSRECGSAPLWFHRESPKPAHSQHPEGHYLLSTSKMFFLSDTRSQTAEKVAYSWICWRCCLRLGTLFRLVKKGTQQKAEAFFGCPHVLTQKRAHMCLYSRYNSLGGGESKGDVSQRSTALYTAWRLLGSILIDSNLIATAHAV